MVISFFRVHKEPNKFEVTKAHVSSEDQPNDGLIRVGCQRLRAVGGNNDENKLRSVRARTLVSVTGLRLRATHLCCCRLPRRDHRMPTATNRRHRNPHIDPLESGKGGLADAAVGAGENHRDQIPVCQCRSPWQLSLPWKKAYW